MPENISLIQILITALSCVSSATLSFLIFAFKDKLFHGKRHQVKRERFVNLIELSQKVIRFGIITQEDRLHLENELRALYSTHFCCKCVVTAMRNQNFYYNLRCIQKSGIAIEYDEKNHGIKPKGNLSKNNAKNRSEVYGWLSAILYFSIPAIIILSLIIKTIYPNLLATTSDWIGLCFSLSLAIASILTMLLSAHLKYKRIYHLCSLKEKIKLSAS